MKSFWRYDQILFWIKKFKSPDEILGKLAIPVKNQPDSMLVLRFGIQEITSCFGNLKMLLH
jgi:hypothetical protein